ncbi:ABC transporter permease [Romboutsia sp. 1001713B170207_170306_H8]|uniref:ABC transporter permease n=1 Tax=Romboutsia sp. 1001713B170207_170306_H8 TaxID=2787112 RepID=UPI0008207AA3|nr:ABC transporter permease [Romboutsia sp. 1001713B170207_170306_H8]SCH83191.1 outer membrane-specific lipoprotein transporter subunit LolE [uncultured Clostridium sp.]
MKKVFKDIEVGDILTIKVPAKEDNKTVYKESKVRVCSTLTLDWMSMGDGQFGNNFEIVTSKNHSESLIGEQKYTKLGINLEDPYDEVVNEKLEEISDRIHLSTFKSRVGYVEWASESSQEYIKSKISLIVLVLIIAEINIFCTIRTNLLVRRKEISTLRALGLSIKNMRKMIIYEALAYSILSFMIALIPAIINLIKFVNLNNDAYINYGIENFMEFTFPVKESIIFLLISITMCLLAAMTANKDFKEMNIIEGIKEND